MRRSVGKVILLVLMTALCFVLTGVAAADVSVTRVVCGKQSDLVIGTTHDPLKIIEQSKFTLTIYDKLNLDDFDNRPVGDTLLIERQNMTVAADVEALLTDDRVQAVMAQVTDAADAAAKKEAFPVAVRADGTTKKIRFFGGTVSDALQAAGIALGEDDLVTPAKETVISKKTVITVQRVTFRETSETEPIAYTSREQQSDALYLGQTQVTQAGRDGVLTKYYLQRIVDGDLADTIPLGEKITVEPTEEVVLVGTKAYMVPQGSINQSGIPGIAAVSELPATMDIAIDSSGRPVNYKQKIIGEATAYSGGGITSTGQAAMPGRVAVDPKEIPYGTKMYIVSCDGKYVYGYCEASDTGGFIHTSDTMVDLYFHSEQVCRTFGRRNVEIYILE